MGMDPNLPNCLRGAPFPKRMQIFLQLECYIQKIAHFRVPDTVRGHCTRDMPYTENRAHYTQRALGGRTQTEVYGREQSSCRQTFARAYAGLPQLKSC